MSHQLTKFLLVFGTAIGLFLLTKPSRMGRKPDSNPNQRTQSENAKIALNAFLKAVNAGEPAANLDALNREIEDEYNLRVYYKRSDQNYYVADTNGKDILSTKASS